MKNYYEVLGVPQTASPEEIKKVFRELSKIYHPDKGTFGDADHATKKFQEINEAYQTLSDLIKRAKYDEWLRGIGDDDTAPKPSIDTPSLNFGSLEIGQQASQQFKVDNLGGPIQEINFTYSPEKSWVSITGMTPHTDSQPCPLVVEVTIDTKGLAMGGHYDGWIEVNFDGQIAHIALALRINNAIVLPPQPQSLRPWLFLGGGSLAVIMVGLVMWGIFGLFTPLPIPVTPVPTATPAPTAIAPPHGKIVFAANVNGTLTIHVARAANIGATSLNVQGWSPSWSPDGQRIVFVSDRTGTTQLYTVLADGTDIIRLTDAPGNKLKPTWSPHGQQIAFVTQTAEGETLTVIDAITGHDIGQTEGHDISQVAWSPDSQMLLFDTEQRVYRVNVDGQDLTPLTEFDSWAGSWSRDGKLIAVSSERGIYTMNRDGQSQLRLTNSRAWSPTWSADGESIAYLTGQDSQLWLMATNGRDQKRLTNAPCWDYVWVSEGDWLACLTGEATALTIRTIHRSAPLQQDIATANERHLAWQ